MVHFPSILDGLVRSMSIKRGRFNICNDVGRETVEVMSKEAKKRDLMSNCSGIVKSLNSHNLSSLFSKRGQKGTNQDTLVVWEEFGCQEDMVFCGIFDGHGPWGHLVSKRVRESLPGLLLCTWQETLVSLSQDLNFETSQSNTDLWFDSWKHSFLKTYEAIDLELKQSSQIDSFRSGSTALTVVKQRNRLAVANVGDSRAVLGTNSEDGTLSAIQLSIDFKPNLHEEAERIRKSQGSVFCMEDEPGVYRVWTPEGRSPGLAVSRAFGDFCVKDFGLVSIPYVTQRNITPNDHFLILATDGVWDVISNEEAVNIVWSTENKEKSARRLVEYASNAWKLKKRGIAIDDISAICLFFNSSTHPDSNDHNLVSKFSSLAHKSIQIPRSLNGL